MLARSLLAALVGTFISAGEANAFLRPHGVEESEEAARGRIVTALLIELAEREDGTRLRSLEEELRPLYAALPKDAQGRLSPSTVRHAVHRYFAQWRGWHMKGLEHGSSHTNATAVDVVEAFGQGQAADLSRLALLVAKLTDIVHQEAQANLRNIYGVLGYSADEPIGRSQAGVALMKYFVMYLLGDGTQDIDHVTLIDAERDVMEVYPAWHSAKLWAKDLDQSLHVLDGTHNPFLDGKASFDERCKTVEELGHRFAAFQNLECKSLKHALMQIEYQGTGRVLLSDFYRVGLNEDWQFNEKTDYLRSLGALDESEPKRPSVFIPNYVLSPTNCLSASGFYTVCCFNECMGLMEHLERHIKAPSAQASQIADLVSHLESDTVAAPRNLSSSLQARLGEIGRLHGGEVPLHGRLFAQWMHHAYPRECPFPHVSGSTRPLSQEEWQRRREGEDPLATKEEMLRVSSTETERHQAQPPSLPWTEVEELLVPSQQWRANISFTPLRWAAMLGALASVAVPLLRASKAPRAFELGSKAQSRMV